MTRMYNRSVDKITLDMLLISKLTIFLDRSSHILQRNQTEKKCSASMCVHPVSAVKGVFKPDKLVHVKCLHNYKIRTSILFVECIGAW